MQLGPEVVWSGWAREHSWKKQLRCGSRRLFEGPNFIMRWRGRREFRQVRRRQSFVSRQKRQCIFRATGCRPHLLHSGAKPRAESRMSLLSSENVLSTFIFWLSDGQQYFALLVQKPYFSYFHLLHHFTPCCHSNMFRQAQ